MASSSQQAPGPAAANAGPQALQNIRKRLIICCDGTWNDSTNTHNPMTNVARISRCIRGVASDGYLQIVYYATGIGARKSTMGLGSMVDGATGRGLHANVRNAYTFICQNYNFDTGTDELYLMGFSRGAFTVRCLAAFIDSVGLLNKRGLGHLYNLYKVWRHESALKWSGFRNRREKSRRAKVQMSTTPEENAKAYLQGNLDMVDLGLLIDELQSRRLMQKAKSVPIKVCALWDTVSALGMPVPGGVLRGKTDMSFVEQRFPTNLANAFHALALDEKRFHFAPVMWKHPPASAVVRQCWFLGSHSNVGGGYEDLALSNIPLIWMIAQLKECTELQFEQETLNEVLMSSSVVIATTNGTIGIRWNPPIPQSWTDRIFDVDSSAIYRSHKIASYTIAVAKMKHRGKSSKSMKPGFMLMGARRRRPGDDISPLHFTPILQQEAERMSSHHNETIHPSVRLLLSQGFELSSALRSCQTVLRGNAIHWQLETSDRTIPEDKMSSVEWADFERWLFIQHRLEKRARAVESGEISVSNRLFSEMRIYPLPVALTFGQEVVNRHTRYEPTEADDTAWESDEESSSTQGQKECDYDSRTLADVLWPHRHELQQPKTMYRGPAYVQNRG